MINFTKFQEDRAILLSNKAAASLKMGQKEKAIEDCTEALELNPNYVKALLRRAQTYEDTDKPHEAMKDFEKILELDPGNKDARMAVLVRCYFDFFGIFMIYMSGSCHLYSVSNVEIGVECQLFVIVIFFNCG